MARKPVLKVARKGYDISADNRFLNIDSTKNTLKLFGDYSGTVSVTGGANYYQTVEIEHNLGYQPYAEVYFQKDSSGYWQKAPSLDYSTSTFIISHSVSSERTDNNTLTVYFESGDFMSGGIAADFDYLIRIYINAWEGSWNE